MSQGLWGVRAAASLSILIVCAVGCDFVQDLGSGASGQSTGQSGSQSTGGAASGGGAPQADGGHSDSGCDPLLGATRTPWQTIHGAGPIPLLLAPDDSGLKPADVAWPAIPDPCDLGWAPPIWSATCPGSPPASDAICYLGTYDGEPGRSADFSYYETWVSLPEGACEADLIVSAFEYADGARLDLVNATNQESAIFPFAKQAMTLGNVQIGGLVPGEVTRVVLTLVTMSATPMLAAIHLELGGAAAAKGVPLGPVPVAKCD